jgi:antitoxin MazE2
MTMLSFRVADAEAAEAQQWAEQLGVDRSELLRDALHRHLVALRVEREADRHDELPPTDSELAPGEIADWGPAEDWADWRERPNDAAR